MALALKDLMKKADEKGFSKPAAPSSATNSLHRLWQQESVLFNSTASGNELEVKIENTLENKSGVKTENELDNILGNNQGTVREQTENTSGTIREPLGNNRGTNREQIRDQIESESENILGNDSENQNIRLELLRLTGIQESLFFYAFDLCLSREDGTTGFILTQQMSETLNCSYESAKISLKRLIKKGLIHRLKGKTSRGGFIILKVPKEVKVLVLQLKRNLKSGNKADNRLENKLDNMNSYSSNNINTTIIEDAFEKIDISPLEHIGFTKKHLSHLKNSTSSEIIQDSIHHFAFGLKNNKRVGEYKEPLNVFIGTLRKGTPWVEANYISAEEIALQQLLDAKKQQQSRVAKLHEEILNLEFASWRDSLTEEEKNKIAPPGKLQMPQNVALSLYFKENLWPAIRAKVLRET